MFKLVKFLKKEGKDVNGGRCLRGTNGRLPFSEKDQKRVRKEHMEKMMNKENTWDQKTEIGIVEGPVEEVRRNSKCIAENKIRKSIWTLKSEHRNDKCKWESWN